MASANPGRMWKFLGVLHDPTRMAVVSYSIKSLDDDLDLGGETKLMEEVVALVMDQGMGTHRVTCRKTRYTKEVRTVHITPATCHPMQGAPADTEDWN